jgi:hypothetical protein
MEKVFLGFLFIIFISACSSSKQEGFISKTSTNFGIICQNDDALSPKAIYGDDNRLDWFESPGRTKDYWARATVALLPMGAIAETDGKVKIYGSTYEESVGLCPGHRFAKQPTAAYCSGFLVSDEIIVTAGHCIRDVSDCQRTQFIFDFAKTVIDQEDFYVPSTSVYGCQEIIARETGANDFALVRLNRKVTDRVPLNVRRSGSLSIGEQVMLIGHPMGMPSKISDGGIVQSVGQKILASVDAFAANSGSVILNSKSGLAEGILVAGEVDFQYKNGCKIEAVCGNNCSGEVITPISKLLNYIPNINYQNPICE